MAPSKYTAHPIPAFLYVCHLFIPHGPNQVMSKVILSSKSCLYIEIEGFWKIKDYYLD